MHALVPPRLRVGCMVGVVALLSACTTGVLGAAPATHSIHSDTEFHPAFHSSPTCPTIPKIPYCKVNCTNIDCSVDLGPFGHAVLNVDLALCSTPTSLHVRVGLTKFPKAMFDETVYGTVAIPIPFVSIGFKGYNVGLDVLVSIECKGNKTMLGVGFDACLDIKGKPICPLPPVYVIDNINIDLPKNCSCMPPLPPGPCPVPPTPTPLPANASAFTALGQATSLQICNVNKALMAHLPDYAGQCIEKGNCAFTPGPLYSKEYHPPPTPGGWRLRAHYVELRKETTLPHFYVASISQDEAANVIMTFVGSFNVELIHVQIEKDSSVVGWSKIYEGDRFGVQCDSYLSFNITTRVDCNTQPPYFSNMDVLEALSIPCSCTINTDACCREIPNTEMEDLAIAVENKMLNLAFEPFFNATLSHFGNLTLVDWLNKAVLNATNGQAIQCPASPTIVNKLRVQYLDAASQFYPTWNDKESGARKQLVTYRPIPPPGWFVMGYYAQGDYNPISGKVAIVQPVVTDPSAPLPLQPPSNISQIWNDRGTGSMHECEMYTVNAPDGYLAVGGIVHAGHGNSTVDNNLMTVHAQCLVQCADGGEIWDDIGTGAKHEVGVWVAGAKSTKAVATGVLMLQPDHAHPPSSNFLCLNPACIAD